MPLAAHFKAENGSGRRRVQRIAEVARIGNHDILIDLFRYAGAQAPHFPADA